MSEKTLALFVVCPVPKTTTELRMIPRIVPQMVLQMVYEMASEIVDGTKMIPRLVF